MEEQTIKNLYKLYVENVLNIKYKKLIIKHENRTINSKVCLASKDGILMSKYFYKITELENGKCYIGYGTTADGGIENVFFDSDGNIIKNMNQFYIGDFKENIARIRSINDKANIGYINTKGEILGDINWGASSKDFKNGRAQVVSNAKGTLGKYGFINEEGKLVIPCSSINFYEFSDDVVCSNEGSLMKYYDKDGNFLFSSACTEPYFQEGLVKYQDKNKWGFKNKKGEIVINAKYKKVSNFSNGYAQLEGNEYIDLTGKKVKLTSFEKDSVKYEKGLLKNIYYNNVKKTYDKLNCIPYKDLNDYVLCIKDNKFIIYSKETGVYTNTNIDLSEEKMIYTYQNILDINGILFYLKPEGCINISNVINLNDIMSYEDNDEIIDYEIFKINILKDKSFYDKIVSESEKIKQKNITQAILNSKKQQDKKRQELLDQMVSLSKQLNKLNDSAGNLSKIDNDLLLTKVDNHFEIKSEFIKQLSYLDLSYIDFTNVKVSGIDFSGTNADINPQLVYNKDMSNSNYQGLNFTSKDFNGVNIKGSNFLECNMDFALIEDAIKDENTIFTDIKIY